MNAIELAQESGRYAELLEEATDDILGMDMNELSGWEAHTHGAEGADMVLDWLDSGDSVEKAALVAWVATHAHRITSDSLSAI